MHFHENQATPLSLSTGEEIWRDTSLSCSKWHMQDVKLLVGVAVVATNAQSWSSENLSGIC